MSVVERSADERFRDVAAERHSSHGGEACDQCASNCRLPPTKKQSDPSERDRHTGPVIPLRVQEIRIANVPTCRVASPETERRHRKADTKPGDGEPRIELRRPLTGDYLPFQ